MKNNISRISKEDINTVLSSVKRQYFVGNLSLPQELPYIKDENLEIGITYYDKATTEKPHFHPIQTEYGYILSGECTWVDITTNEEFIYSEGDFFIIKPNTCYTQSSKENTKILFIKTPSINDKQICSTCSKKCTYNK